MAADSPLQLHLSGPLAERQAPPCVAQEKAILAWVADLPLAEPRRCSSLLVDGLAAFDQQQLKAGEYLKVLRGVVRAADDIADTLRREIRNHALPLSNQGNETASQIRDLHRQLANGYKRVLATHESAGLLGTLSKKDLLAALQGAMVYLAELLFDYFQVYQQPETGIWEDLHQLYLYAEECQLLDAPVTPLATPAGDETSIKRHYLRLLLLSLASPYRLRQGEVEWVHNALRRWVTHCNILIPPDHESGLGVLTIDLLADEPADQPPPGRLIGPERYRILTTIDLLPVLRGELTQLHEQGTVEQTSDGGALSPDIYKRLTQAWSTTPQRSYSRSERTSELQITVGFRSIHHFIESENQAAEIRPSRLDRGQDDSTGGQAADQERDIWKLAYGPDYNDLVENLDQLPEAHRCGTINESAGGYCLTTRREADLRARVGELIGIHNAQANHPWEIGVIRWLRGGEGDWMEFGVQTVAPYAQAAYIELNDGLEPAGARYPALLLPEVRAMRQPVSLVIESSTYPAGTEITLTTSKGSVNITLARLLEATGSYSLYQFSAQGGVMEHLDI